MGFYAGGHTISREQRFGVELRHLVGAGKQWPENYLLFEELFHAHAFKLLDVSLSNSHIDTLVNSKCFRKELLIGGKNHE